MSSLPLSGLLSSVPSSRCVAIWLKLGATRCDPTQRGAQTSEGFAGKRFGTMEVRGVARLPATMRLRSTASGLQWLTVGALLSTAMMRLRLAASGLQWLTLGALLL